MPQRIWLAGCLCLAAAGAQAAGFDPRMVASSAQWYVHVDVDAAHASPVAQKIRTQMLEQDRVKQHLQELQDKFHFDPSQDLHAVTAYGDLKHPHHGVTVIRADFERDIVVSRLKDKRDFKTTAHGDHQIYSWSERRHGRHHRGADGGRDHVAAGKDDGGKEQDGHKHPSEHSGHTIALSMIKGQLAVMAHSVEAVEAALDVIDGKSAALSPLAVDATSGAIVQAKVAGLSEAGLPFKSPVLAQCERLSISLSDLDGQMSASAQLGTKSAETAGQIDAILEGFRALAQLRHGSQAEVKQALDELNVDASGSTVSLRWELSDDDVLKLRDKVHELRKQVREHHADHGHHHGTHRNRSGGDSKSETRPDSSEKPKESK